MGLGTKANWVGHRRAYFLTILTCLSSALQAPAELPVANSLVKKSCLLALCSGRIFQTHRGAPLARQGAMHFHWLAGGGESSSPCVRNAVLPSRLAAATIRPACDLLPLELLSETESITCAPIRLDHVDFGSLTRYITKCDLCRLLLDLDHYWRSDQCKRPMSYDGVTYESICGRNTSRVRYTEHSHISISVGQVLNRCTKPRQYIVDLDLMIMSEPSKS